MQVLFAKFGKVASPLRRDSCFSSLDGKNIAPKSTTMSTCSVTDNLHHSHTMLKRRKSVVLAGVLLTVGIFWIWFARSEPKYHGHTLGQWFAVARADGAEAATLDEFHTAVYVLGTNNFPGLVRRISFDANRCLPQRIFNILPGSITPRRLLEYLLDKKWNEDAQATDAMEVFRMLGPQGAPAIPGLTKIAMYGPHAPAHRAVDCLGYIGEDAIPALIMVATNPQPQNFRAFGWLVAFTNSPEAMRIVTQHSRDPNFEVLVGTPPPDGVITNTPAH